MSLPDFTKQKEWPIFGDTLTFNVVSDHTMKQYVGIISEWNVGGPAIWTVKTEEGLIFHVDTTQIVDVKHTGIIPDYIPNNYNSENDLL